MSKLNKLMSMTWQWMQKVVQENFKKNRLSSKQLKKFLFSLHKVQVGAE